MPVALELTAGRDRFLTAPPTSSREQRAVLTAMVALALVFVVIAPFAKVALPPLPEFVPVYQFALVVNHLLIALLGTQGLALLASGHLFAALVATAHSLAFPGVFASDSLVAFGPQSSAWLYLAWHAGFPLLVLVYGLEDPRGQPHPPGARGRAIASSVLAVLAAVVAVVWLLTAGHDLLPALRIGHRYTSAMTVAGSNVALLGVFALVVLWRRPLHSVLDRWLMLVLCAWTLATALAAVLNAGGFDVGFYAGRVFELVATCVFLMVLVWRGE